RAQVPEFAAGKTGTTENYGDAWFVGFTKRYTVAVWVGYPNQLRSMKTDFAGQPVAGGTYPAQIWHDFMVAIEAINARRAAAPAAADGGRRSVGALQREREPRTILPGDRIATTRQDGPPPRRAAPPAVDPIS